MGLQKGLILENYATLANVSAWLMIVYFASMFIGCVLLIFCAILIPEELAQQHTERKVKKIKPIKYLVMALVFSVCYILISLNQVFLPVFLLVSYVVTYFFIKFAIYIYEKVVKEFKK